MATGFGYAAFAGLASQIAAEEKEGKNPWPWLLRHDAPGALGKTFAACVGATVLDGAEFNSNTL